VGKGAEGVPNELQEEEGGFGRKVRKMGLKVANHNKKTAEIFFDGGDEEGC